MTQISSQLKEKMQERARMYAHYYGLRYESLLSDFENFAADAVEEVFQQNKPKKKYSINGWDYHGHHTVEEFEASSVEEAIEKFNKESMYSYGDCTLYECPNGFRTSCQTISSAGYREIINNGK